MLLHTFLNKGDDVNQYKPASFLNIKFKERSELSGLPDIQSKILNNASKYVKVGGTLVYSTCTINKMENEEMIKYFLKKHKEFKLLEVHQLLPTNKNDGFYIAKMIREN